MKDIIENLYPMNACLLGEGYDNRLEYLKMLLKLEVISIPSGTKVGTWTVPDEWVVRDAWIKFNGKKIVDYKKQPLSLVVGSLPFSGKVNSEELKKHLYTQPDHKDAIPYVYKYYDKDWGFCMTHDDSLLLQEGEYEVFIDTEYKPGKMNIGVHTIPGKTDREILLFAHLDHPFMANDNLSGVACLADLAPKIKSDYTIKIIFCPETIGSIAYAETQDISKVDLVLAVDICGNDKPIMVHKAFNQDHKANKIVQAAVHSLGRAYRKAKFRSVIGSDEYYFNDPQIGIPGFCLTTFDYPEYHLSSDTPDKIDYEAIKRMQDLILKIIEVYEKDFIPKREFKGPLMLSKYELFSGNKQINLNYDYFFYSIDGKKSIAELCSDFEMSFDMFYDLLVKMEKDGTISRVDPCKD